MASKRSGNKPRSGVVNAGKRTVAKRGALLRDLEAKNQRQVRGGGSISFNFGTIKNTYSEQ